MLQATAGGSGDTFPLPTLTCLHGVASPAAADARITIQADGDVERVQGAGVTDIGDWISPKARMSDYECQVVPTSGTLSTGVVSTWQALTVDRQYGVAQAGIGSKAFTGTFQLRRIGDTMLLVSVAISLTATVS